MKIHEVFGLGGMPIEHIYAELCIPIAALPLLSPSLLEGNESGQRRTTAALSRKMARSGIADSALLPYILSVERREDKSCTS